MDRKLIIDSGSTKTHWALLDDGKLINEFFTEGFNPNYVSRSTISKILSNILHNDLEQDTIEEIHFYGSGCSSVANCAMVKSVFWELFSAAKIFINHDLYGAALALLRHSEGIACILGTGSNSCLWDGSKIVDNVPSLGYILGDEGSGTYIGKLLLKEILSERVGKELTEAFYDYVQMDFTQILHKIYKEYNANQWIASLAKFAQIYSDNAFINKILYMNFQDFVRKQLAHYKGIQKLPVAFTGSVAFYFSNILQEVMDSNGIKVLHIMKVPMEGLIAYHLKTFV